jgi:hypothetical protein
VLDGQAHWGEASDTQDAEKSTDQVVLKMQKTIYGSVQAAQAFWIKLENGIDWMIGMEMVKKLGKLEYGGEEPV